MIFVSLREDYPNFNNWINACNKKERDAWVISCDEKYGVYEDPCGISLKSNLSLLHKK